MALRFIDFYNKPSEKIQSIDSLAQLKRFFCASRVRRVQLSIFY
jgi:hypothetical protein